MKYRVKQLTLVVFCTIMLTITKGKAQGIQFAHGDFSQIMNTARKSEKLIFIDFYTSWCGPCKIMAANVFPLAAVGGYFNEHFVNYKLDAEKEGKALAKRYNVVAYPTYVFLKPDGSEITKSTGSMSADRFLQIAEKAYKMSSDPNNLANLKSRYEENKNNPDFLRGYIDKMISFKEAPITAIEAYLKEQKAIDERSSRMMEFLLKYDEYITFGGEAERILNKNIVLYREIATKTEDAKLNSMLSKMLHMSRRIALRDSNPGKYDDFIRNWLTFNGKTDWDQYTRYQLELLMLKKEPVAYKRLAVQYLDSLINSQTTTAIKEEDKASYERYAKKVPYVADNFMIKAYHRMQQDVIARRVVGNIVPVCRDFLSQAEKKDLPQLQKWTGYAKTLLPEHTELNNLEADMMYKLVDKSKGIAAKQLLINRLKGAKEAVPLREQLQKMEKGTY